ncbi:response regulator [Massilia sp. IC2-477]|uniref:hybrid sensor histidine kinase/response regulator n=1 Tax=Massilia sp. IC2-477 TaxID=2887198 RepID=UPI001D1273E8|nr:ATP-binding protein [Massilia sp. IC2-477]MCC2955648.1 response regulator [Massilia sp. IC2-477]
MTAPGHASVLFICERPLPDQVLERVASELGETIEHARSPAEGLARLARQDFALVLVGYAGDAAAQAATVRQVRATRRSAHTPLVAIGVPGDTAFPVESLYEAGAVAVLTEPLSPVILRAKLRFYIDAFVATAERRRAEAALIDARARLESIIAAAELAIWTWDMEADLVIGDTRMAELFGVPEALREGAPATRFFEAIHRDDLARVEALLADAVARGAPYDATFRVRAEGGWRWVIARGNVVRGPVGGAGRMRGVVIDASRQFEAEQQLRLSEERYRTLFDSIDEGVCVIEMLYDSAGQPCDYRFLETNPAFEKHTGLVGAVGRTVRQLAPRLERHWFDLYGRVVATGEPVRYMNEARELGRWFDVYAGRIGPPEQHRVAVVFNDITERRKGEEALRKMAADLEEANRIKTEFLATLAHELRNPLAPLRSGLQFIRSEGGPRADPAAVARIHEIMDRQLGQLVHLVDDLLDVARITRGQIALKRERIDLAGVLSAAVETSMPLIEAARHHIDLRMPHEALVVDADATRLTQVVSNLLNNAARYTPRGGSIVLAAERDGVDAVIAVSDNGIGIDPARLEDVFTMFTQIGEGRRHAAGGLGIGLSLVRSLVELHGGSVHAASAGTNAGSVFTVRLPLAAAPEEPPLASGPAPGAAGERPVRRVLVVDDNRDAAETLAAVLGQLGHQALVANDGHQALRMMAGFQPEVVFLDLGMPGMSGYDVAGAIRSEPAYAGVRLVALTGWGGAADRERTARAGFDHHLTKPATTAAIEEVLA